MLFLCIMYGLRRMDMDSVGSGNQWNENTEDEKTGHMK